MNSLAIAQESTAALAEADAAGCPLAAAFLRVRVPELLRQVAARLDCRECEYHPHETPTTRRHKHA